MKTTKLTIGILSIVFSVFIFFQSTLVGIGNTLSRSKEVSGSAGIIVALLMLTAGIISIATRNGGRGGVIATAIIYVFAFLIGFSNFGSYKDLSIWSTLCLIFAIIQISSLFKSKGVRAIFIIVSLIFLFFVLSIANKGADIADEIRRENIDLANLRAAKAAAVTVVLTGDYNGKKVKDGDILWYNAETGHLLETPVTCGVGTDEKCPSVNYSENVYKNFRYDGSSTEGKGIRIVFTNSETGDINTENTPVVEFADTK